MLSDPAHKIGRPRRTGVELARRDFVPLDQRGT
jgi:citrate synthase